MKVLFITNSLYNGGSNKVCSDLESRFAQEHNTFTIVLDSKNNNKYTIIGEVKNICVGTRPFPFRAWISLFLQIFKSISIVRQYKPDVIISFSSHSNFINLASKLLTPSIKRVLTHHEDTFDFIKNHSFLDGLTVRFFNNLVFLLRTKKDAFVCVSENIKTSLERHYKIRGKIDVIHNGISTEKVELAKTEKVELPSPYIVSVGTLCKIKNQQLIIRAFSKISNKINHSLVFVGDGPDRKNLEELTIQLGIKERVVFTGFQSNPYKFMQNASLFAFASLTESFCLAILEAMYLGLPCVVVKNAGISEVVGDSNGAYLIDEFEVDDLADVILLILNDKNLREGLVTQGAMRAKEFLIENQYHKFLQVINN